MMAEQNPAPALHLYTAFGIELEYMIVDGGDFRVRPLADRVLQTDDGAITDELDRGSLSWSNELALHAIELKTRRPAKALEGWDARFQRDIAHITERLAPFGARLMPSAAHPFMDPSETRLWPHGNADIYRTFDRIFGCRGHGWGNLQSAHLNLPFFDDDEFTRLHSAIRLALPLIPALSAASPFLDGRDSGMLDARLEHYRHNCSRIFSITAHVVPEAISGIRAYHEQILEPMYRDLQPFDPEGILRHEWTNARGAIARFDRQTVEIRIIDVQECPRADLSIFMLLTRLPQRLTQDRNATAAGDRLSAERLSLTLQDTARDGENAVIHDGDYLQSLDIGRSPLRAGEIWRALAESLPPLPSPYRDAIDIILSQGTLASRMKRITGDCTPENMRATCRTLCDCLEQGQLLML